MSKGIPMSPAMQAFIRENKERMSQAELAYHLTEMSGIPVSRHGVHHFLWRERQETTI